MTTRRSFLRALATGSAAAVAAAMGVAPRRLGGGTVPIENVITDDSWPPASRFRWRSVDAPVFHGCSWEPACAHADRAKCSLECGEGVVVRAKYTSGRVTLLHALTDDVIGESEDGGETWVLHG